MNMVELEEKDGIFTLFIPKTFTLDAILEIQCYLDKILLHDGPTALIIASKTPKIFNAGMDLKFLQKHGRTASSEIFKALMQLLGRILKFGVPTISAINGHMVAGGLMLALATDYRVMTNGIGSAKMTEITLGMFLPRGGNHVLNVKLTPDVHRELLLRGKAFSPQECLDRKIVDYLVSGEKVMEKAIEIAKEVMQFGERKRVYELLKVSTYEEAINLALEAKSSPDEIAVMNPKI